MAARDHSEPMYRNQQATFENGRRYPYRHMKATEYAGWPVECW